jgi:concentrative nucleoside transporter, CNT family
VPETGQPVTARRNKKDGEAALDSKDGGPEIDATEVEVHRDSNFLAAIARGTTDGLNLAINVGAMLISFLALIALTNGVLGAVHNAAAYYGFARFPSDLQTILGVVFSPVAWLIGIPWRDAPIIGGLLGTRMVLNELVAFSFLGPMKATLDPRTFTIATFALCGFANLSSIGIQIGGIGALAPNKKDELARLGFRAMIAGTMANLMSAAIVGILY